MNSTSDWFIRPQVIINTIPKSDKNTYRLLLPTY